MWPRNNVISSLLLPIINGTCAEASGASGAKGPPGKRRPSITGLKPSRRRSAKAARLTPASTLTCASRSFATGMFLSSPARAISRPRWSSIWRAVFVPSSRSAICTAGPLWTIALWKSPLADGMAISTLTFAPPPDSPKMVTLRGSPPNRAILSRTHSRAATMSSTPARPPPAKLGPAISSRWR